MIYTIGTRKTLRGWQAFVATWEDGVRVAADWTGVYTATKEESLALAEELKNILERAQ